MSGKPKTANQRIAETIFKQMGGIQFAAMVGYKQAVAIESGLSFKFGRNNSKSNIVKITLKPNDLYEMEFGHLRKIKYETRYFIDRIYSDVYNDCLALHFASHTGMSLLLGGMPGLPIDELRKLSENEGGNQNNPPVSE